MIRRKYILKTSLYVLSAVIAFNASGIASANTLAVTTPEKQSFRSMNEIYYYNKTGCSNSETESSSGPAGNSNVDCGVDKDGDQGNKDKIWGYLVQKFQDKGYSKGEAEKAAAGVMGNMWQETGGSFNPNIDHGMGCNNGPAIGLNQWCFSRQTDLKTRGDEKGTGWGCLGTQLDFLWSEMDSSGFSHLFEMMKGKAPGESAVIFDDGGDGPSSGTRGFEESIASDNSKRAGYAEDIYKEYTGSSPNTSVADSSSSTPDDSTSASQTCTEAAGESASDGSLPSEECAALIEEYNALKTAGKIKYQGREADIAHDLENCTTDQIDCGTGGGKGGVNPKILRALVAAGKNSGASSLTQWNFNTGHGCDGLNHPRGMATDIFCNGNDSQTGQGASEDCNKLFKYFYDNYDQLGLTELIWQYPPTGYSCNDPKILCNVSGHADHIHVGARV